MNTASAHLKEYTNVLLLAGICINVDGLLFILNKNSLIPLPLFKYQSTKNKFSPSKNKLSRL